jgi:hypothetical protein
LRVARQTIFTAGTRINQETSLDTQASLIALRSHPANVTRLFYTLASRLAGSDRFRFVAESNFLMHIICQRRLDLVILQLKARTTAGVKEAPVQAV